MDTPNENMEICQPVTPEAVKMARPHRCDFCGKPATHCYREGRGTGHSEHVCACKDHQEDDDGLTSVVGIFNVG